MTDDKLSTYRRKRDPDRTPEPVPAETAPPDTAAPQDTAAAPRGNDDTFVIQEHHATALHWDFRLERDGVLVSWAIPKGLPLDPKKNRLAVQTEDHPLEYAAFEDVIPKGEYGGGTVKIWDRGTYETEKWSDREVMVVLHGGQANGKYVLFHTGGKNWMIHRMDPPPTDWEPLPELIRPMLASVGATPKGDDDAKFAYEMKWDGVRAVVYVDGGRVRALTRNDLEVVATYPELRELGLAMGSTTAVLDGEIVAMDDDGRISFGVLQQRMHVQGPKVRRLAEQLPVTYLVFDLLYLNGRSLLEEPYERRRELLESLDLVGPRWSTPPAFRGVEGADVLAASEEQGLEGIVGKRLTSTYEPGRRSRDWIKIKNFRTQEVVVGGWRPGKGNRESTIGSLLLGVPTADGLEFVGHVGTGFTQPVLEDLTTRLAALQQDESPFVGILPSEVRRDAHWTRPELVGEVQFGEWTRERRLRHPTWRGLRPDKSPADVAFEPAPSPR